MADLTLAAAYVAALTGSADTALTWQILPDRPGAGAPSSASDPRWHGTLAGLGRDLERANLAGYGVFATVNVTDGRGRRAENVTALRALFVDSDDGLLPDSLPIDPAIRVQTARGEHAYWLLRPGEYLARFRGAQRHLISALGTDRSIVDLPRVMRVPGFDHCKADRVAVTMSIGPRVLYSIDEILAAFPVHQHYEHAVTTGRAGRPAQTKLERYRAKLAKLALTPHGRRHNALYATAIAGAELVERGELAEEDLRAGLAQALVHWDLDTASRADADRTIHDALDRGERAIREGVATDKNGIPLRSQANAMKLLRSRDVELFWDCRKNAPSARAGGLPWDPESEERDLVEADIPAALALLERSAPGWPRRIVGDALYDLARAQAVDPVAEWLDSLVWDRTPRLEHWLATYCGAEDSLYTRTVGPRWLVSAVARAMQPGCRARGLLILEGDGGIGKNSVFEELVGPRWCAEIALSGNEVKRLETLQRAWVGIVSEFAEWRGRDQDALKEFLTRPLDVYRAPYARTAEEHPRRWVLGACTNHAVYLAEDPGNSRYWPVTCGHIDWQAVRRDRDQLWAEAVVAYRWGLPWWLTREEDKRLIAPARAGREESDVLEPRVVEILARGARWEGLRAEIGPGLGETRWIIPPGAREVAPAALAAACETTHYSSVRRCGRVLRALGWLPHHTVRGTVYRRP